jgi:hypothetical protein
MATLDRLAQERLRKKNKTVGDMSDAVTSSEKIRSWVSTTL